MSRPAPATASVARRVVPELAAAALGAIGDPPAPVEPIVRPPGRISLVALVSFPYGRGKVSVDERGSDLVGEDGLHRRRPNES